MNELKFLKATCDSPSQISEDYPKWTTLDAIWWKTFGGDDYLIKYKDGYILFHRERIKEIANRYHIPATLLASVARVEAGGMPDHFKDTVLNVRQADFPAKKWMERNITTIGSPEKTSMGIIAMQIRVVAEIFGKNPDSLTNAEMTYISICLQKDNFNLAMTAQHLNDLIHFDYPDIDTMNLNDEQFVIAGSRYNRGIQRNLNDFIRSYSAKEGTSERVWTSYGRAMLRNRERVNRLLYGNASVKVTP